MRLYVLDLNRHKQSNLLNEQIINIMNSEMRSYKQVVQNNDSIIAVQNRALADCAKVNEDIQKNLDKYKKRSSLWPVWLSGGFVTGAVLTAWLLK